MLNRAARFFPILKELKSHQLDDADVLEVGSGSLGIGEFWNGPFVGCDMSFPTRPLANMRPVRCSGHQLPFSDNSFDAVVVSDVMEHVPPQYRQQVVSEVLRVARKIVVFGYPCGPAAFALDRKLYGDYHDRRLPMPPWLEEHMQHPFPDENLFANLPPGWKREILPNESLHFHYWMMRAEMFRLVDYSFRMALRFAPRIVESLLQFAHREPSYRKIFVLTRESEPAHA